MAGKGQPKTGGRKRDTPNKTTRSVKEAILEAFERAGGAKYLAQVAKRDPRTFCALLGRLLPAEIKADIATQDDEEMIQCILAARNRARAHLPANGSDADFAPGPSG